MPHFKRLLIFNFLLLVLISSKSDQKDSMISSNIELVKTILSYLRLDLFDLLIFLNL
jgi:hypothetical protein